MAGALAASLEEALEVLGESRDIVAGRPRHGAVPDWATRRGWATFLSALPDDLLIEAERDPAAWLATCAEAPASLRSVARSAAELTQRYEYSGNTTPDAPRARHVKKRKSAQLHALCAVSLERFAGVSRIVDLGSGHGHLTRALALALGPDEALGVDWDDARIERAIDLSAAPDDVAAGVARFVHGDATTTATANELAAHDLVTGLHPCGALGDALVVRARDAGAHVLAVSCCYQKTEDAQRHPLSEQAKRSEFVVPKEALGLANLSPKSFEGSRSLATKRAGRRTRLALRLALEARGLVLEPGAEGRGLTKGRTRHGLEDVAPPIFAARGLAPPTALELRHAEHLAIRAHGEVARYALPRHALARLLELAIVLDRARFLEEAGWETDVFALFPRRTSPRNLGIVANAPP